jgi:two-component system, response regulator PdtaR
MGVKVVASSEARKPAILIVEDDAIIASYVKEVLAEAGFTITGIAASGPEALSLAAAGCPGLALVDIGLTGPIDGIELAGRLREEFGVPSIFLSGRDDQATMRRAAAVWPLGFIAKPFVPSRVFAAIERAFAIIAADASAAGSR